MTLRIKFFVLCGIQQMNYEFSGPAWAGWLLRKLLTVEVVATPVDWLGTPQTAINGFGEIRGSI